MCKNQSFTVLITIKYVLCIITFKEFENKDKLSRWKNVPVVMIEILLKTDTAVP